MAKKKTTRKATPKPAATTTKKRPAKPKRTPRKIRVADDEEETPPADEPYPQPPIEADDEATPLEDGIVADQLGETAAEAPAEPEPRATAAPTFHPESATALELEHYHQIRELNKSVRSLFFEWKTAKEETATLKKDLDARNEELQKLISRGPEAPLPLFAPPKPKADEPTPAADATPEAPAEWKSRPVTVLGLADGAVRYLDEGGIATLGDLAAFWIGKRELVELANIGPETAAAIADAYAEYGAAHPELYGQPPIVAEATTAEESIDQETDDEPLFGDEDGPEEEEAPEAA